LEGRARELLVVQTLGDVPPELSLTPEIDERLGAQAQRIGPAETVRVLDLLGGALEAVRAGADPRTQLELALVKAATPQADGSTRALLARIERLEQALAGRPASPISAAPSPAPTDSLQPPPHAPAREVGVPVAALSQPTSVTAPAQPVPVESTPPQPTPAGSASAQPMPVESAPVGPEPTQPAPVEPTPVERTPMPQPAEPVSSAEVPDAAPVPARAVEPSAEDEQEPVAPPVAVVTLPTGELDSLWPAVHESVKAEHGLLGAVFNEAVPAVLTDNELTLAFAPSAAFLKRKAEDPANRVVLIDTLQRLTGRRYRVAFELREDLDVSDEQNGGAPTEEEIVARLVAELDAEELPEDWLQQEKGA
jgi:DNA polymerase-3 subunit gamma/tau